MSSLLSQEAAAGVRDPAALGGLQRDARAKAQGLHDWLVAQRSAGNTVLGYGAASRAGRPAAKADQSLIRAVADASPAKQGRRMPGTDIPVVGSDRLASERPAAVVLFLADLLPEVRAAFPGVEAAGGRWVNAEMLRSGSAA